MGDRTEKQGGIPRYRQIDGHNCVSPRMSLNYSQRINNVDICYHTGVRPRIYLVSTHSRSKMELALNKCDTWRLLFEVVETVDCVALWFSWKQYPQSLSGRSLSFCFTESGHGIGHSRTREQEEKQLWRVLESPAGWGEMEDLRHFWVNEAGSSTKLMFPSRPGRKWKSPEAKKCKPEKRRETK